MDHGFEFWPTYNISLATVYSVDVDVQYLLLHCLFALVLPLLLEAYLSSLDSPIQFLGILNIRNHRGLIIPWEHWLLLLHLVDSPHTIQPCSSVVLPLNTHDLVRRTPTPTYRF
jgi:hypothetical protein